MITKDSKNILVVDDSAFFRTKLKDILENGGHKAWVARDGQEAIDEIKKDHGRIDLLILDLHMPVVDGFGVLEWINSNGYKGSFPILVISTVRDEPGFDSERLKRLGVNGIISKGFSPQQVILHANKFLFADKAVQGKNPRKRVPVSIPANFTVRERQFQAFILNISDSGVFLMTETELHREDPVCINFSLPEIDREIGIKGVVRWTTAETGTRSGFKGCGIMFTHISSADHAVISNFVEQEGKRLGLDD